MTCGIVNEVYLGEHAPGWLRIPASVQYGWMCVGQVEAYVVNIVSEMYDYITPDEFQTPPHENTIPYEWAQKDG